VTLCHVLKARLQSFSLFKTALLLGSNEQLELAELYARETLLSSFESFCCTHKSREIMKVYYKREKFLVINSIPKNMDASRVWNSQFAM